MDYKSLLIAIIIFFSCLFAIDKNILILNQEIEDIFYNKFYTNSFIENDYDIDKLISRCNELEYLIGEIFLLQIKHRSFNPDDNQITSSILHYKNQLENIQIYKLKRERELYYQFIILYLNGLNDGFDFHLDEMSDLYQQMESNGSLEFATHMLFLIWTETDNNADSKYVKKLIQLFEKHPQLKNTVTYIFYNESLGDLFFNYNSDLAKASEYFSESKIYSQKMNLNKTYEISNYKLYSARLFANQNEPSKNEIEKYMNKLDEIKNIHMPLYLSEIKGYAQHSYRKSSNYYNQNKFTESGYYKTEAKINYEKYIDSFFKYYNNLNKKIEAKQLAMVYRNLAYIDLGISSPPINDEFEQILINLRIGDNILDDWEISINYFRKAIEYAEILKLNGMLIMMYYDLANLYSKLMFKSNDLSYPEEFSHIIDKSISLIGQLNDKTCSWKKNCDIYWSLNFNEIILAKKDLKESPWEYKKLIKLIKSGLNKAVKTQDYNSEYLLLLDYVKALDRMYGDKKSDKKYDMLKKADSLLIKYDIPPKSKYNYLYFSEYSHRGDLNRIRKMLEFDFNYHYAENNYSKLISVIDYWGVWIYGVSKLNTDYAKLMEWINLIKNNITDEKLILSLRLKEMKLEIGHYYNMDDYDKGCSLYSEYLSICNDAYNAEARSNFDVIHLGKSLLNQCSFANNESAFKELLNIVEPMQWKEGDIIGDSWFIQFLNGEKGTFIASLYDKYINRIFSYPLTKMRIEAKYDHAILIADYYGDLDASIIFLQESLLEAKQLDEKRLIVNILSALGKRYMYNMQSKQAMRTMLDGLYWAEYIDDSLSQEIIYSQLFDFPLIEVDKTDYYDLANKYLKVSKRNNSYLGQIQSYNDLNDYYVYIDDSDKLLETMVEAFSIKDSVILYHGELRYLAFLNGCEMNLLNWVSGTNVHQNISQPLVDYLLVREEKPSASIIRIAEEFEYLKNVNYTNLTNRIQYAFHYATAIRNSWMLKESIDGIYPQYDEYQKIIEFLLQLEGSEEIWGMINAFWMITERIKKIEDNRSLDDAYMGYGMTYKPYYTDSEIENFKKQSEQNKLDSLSIDKVIITDIITESPFEKNNIQINDIMLLNEKVSIYRNNNEWDRSELTNYFKKLVKSNKFVDFTYIRKNEDTLNVSMKAAQIKPNPWSSSPMIELKKLYNQAIEITDGIMEKAPHINTYPDFKSDYREFLIEMPFKDYMINNQTLPSKEITISYLEKYENITTLNLINEFIRHKENLSKNELLISEYNKYSDNINKIQIELSKEDLTSDEIKVVNKERTAAYSELEYFENHFLENKADSRIDYDFSFSQDKDMFNEYDFIIRMCTEPDQGGFYIWSNLYSSYSKNTDTTGLNWYGADSFVYHTIREYSDEEILILKKRFMQLLPYSIKDESLNIDINEILLEMTKKLGIGRMSLKVRGKNIPILNDELLKNGIDILVVQEGAANNFPFELLKFRYESDTTSFHYLGEIANITYTPSLNSYIHFQKRKSNRSNKSSLLVSANPNIESAESYMNNLLAFRSNLGDIKYVDNEINNIDKTLSKGKIFKPGFNNTVLKSKFITEKRFNSYDLESYRYIHIAAHGIHDDENPKYSGILLGRDKDDTEDGILQAHEIFPLNLNADLVTLSSCFSGFGEIDPNEGNLGIYRSFLIAGAKSVIISLWNVEDESTSILFSKFYEYLKAGNSKSKSLRLAKMDLKNNPKYSHPFYWAPFILMGES